MNQLYNRIQNLIDSEYPLDLIVTGEYSFTSYTGGRMSSPAIAFDYDAVNHYYTIADGQQDVRGVTVIQAIQNLAAQNRINFALGTICEACQDHTFNTMLMINRNGHIIGMRRKVGDYRPFDATAKQIALDSRRVYTFLSQDDAFFTVFPTICAHAGGVRADQEIVLNAQADLLVHSENMGDVDYDAVTLDIYQDRFDPGMHGWDWMVQDMFIDEYVEARGIIKDEGYGLVAEGGFGYSGFFQLSVPPAKQNVPEIKQKTRYVFQGWSMIATGITRQVTLSRFCFDSESAFASLYAYDTHTQAYYTPTEYKPTMEYWMSLSDFSTLIVGAHPASHLSKAGQPSGLCTANNVPPPASKALLQNDHPDRFELQENYPNPFNHSMRIAFSLTEPAFVEISIYNLSGNCVKRIVKSC